MSLGMPVIDYQKTCPLWVAPSPGWACIHGEKEQQVFIVLFSLAVDELLLCPDLPQS